MKWFSKQWTGSFESDRELPIDGINDDNEENSLDAIGHESNDKCTEEYDPKNSPENASEKTVSTRKRWQSKKKDKEYQMIFNENKHLFNMSCDLCSKAFESLDETRAHYLTIFPEDISHAWKVVGKCFIDMLLCNTSNVT